MASESLVSSVSPLARVSNKASSGLFVLELGPTSLSFLSSTRSTRVPSSRSSLVVKAQQYEGGVQRVGASQLPTTPLVHSPWNTSEDEQELKVRLDMPGVAAEDIDVKVEGDMLVVKDLGRQLYSPYDTKLQLPHNIVTHGIKAFLKNGVLHVTIPKTNPYVIHVPVKLF